MRSHTALPVQIAHYPHLCLASSSPGVFKPVVLFPLCQIVGVHHVYCPAVFPSVFMVTGFGISPVFDPAFASALLDSLPDYLIEFCVSNLCLSLKTVYHFYLRPECCIWVLLQCCATELNVLRVLQYCFDKTSNLKISLFSPHVSHFPHHISSHCVASLTENTEIHWAAAISAAASLTLKLNQPVPLLYFPGNINHPYIHCA